MFIVKIYSLKKYILLNRIEDKKQLI